MVSIRLQRVGKRNSPFYRIVVTDSRVHAKGYVMDIVGHYSPVRDEDFAVDLEKIEKWLSKGAKLTPRARSLVKRAKGGK